jgi:hypothetical protein
MALTPFMKEYKTSQWPIKDGRVNTDHLDRYLNDMQQSGWELFSTAVMQGGLYGVGIHVLCVFVKDKNEIQP